MNLYEYQEKARSTAIYPSDARILYPALGIVGECGEVTEKIKKLIRDDDWDMTEDRKSAIAKELGDCCWYLANICCDTNHDLSMMYEMIGHNMFHTIRHLNLPQLSLHMCRHAIAVATSLEQWYYDRNSRMSERGYYTEIPNHLSNIITCIEEIARRCDFTLENICMLNLEKLCSRKRNGSLGGDGDDR